MPPKLKFTEGEKVLCFHGPLIYEAKCLKSTVTKDKQIKYFVHYAGWSKSWDEWVPESRVLKYNDVNVAKQKEVQKNHSAPVKGKKTKAKSKTDLNSSKGTNLDSRASTPVLETQSEKKSVKTKQPSTPSSSSSDLTQTPDASKKKRAKTENAPEPEGVYESKVEININIPDELKQLLVDDWDIIKRQKKLWTLPASVTVDNILDDFINYMKTNKTVLSNPESAVFEIAAGIKVHFNTVVNTQLLYKIESQQFLDLVDDDVQPSQIYGGIHLLRLFVRLGPNLSYTFMDDNHIQFLVDQLENFLRYLAKNPQKVFDVQTSYSPTLEYLKKVSLT